MADISQYEYMLATTPEDEPDEQADEAFRMAASMLRESLRLIADVFMSDASDGIILLLRFSGMSMAQIGDKRGMSKQAIHKRIVNMGRKWPQLADALINTADYDAELAGHEIKVTQTIQATNARWREATRWMNRQN